MKPRTGVLLLFHLILPRLSFSTPPPPFEDYNVVVIGIDDLRADRVEASREGRPLMPRLSRFAHESFYFPNAVAQAPWTTPSFMSAFTSLYPHEHTVVNKFAVYTPREKVIASLPRRYATLAEVFRSNGYATAAFTGDAGLDGRFGFDRGFDVYQESATFGGFAVTMPAALDWIKARRNKKFFAFVHGYDVHGQFLGAATVGRRLALERGLLGRFPTAEKEFLRLRMRTILGQPIHISPEETAFWKARYDQQAREADERLGNFLDGLDGLPEVSSRTIIVVFSDHGEQFNEHGGFDHGTNLYEEIIHVFAIVREPGSRGARIAGQVRLIDLMPTLIARLGLRAGPTVREQMRGTDLSPLLSGRALSLAAFSETDFLLQSFKRCLREPSGWKLIYDLNALSEELFDLNQDSGEKSDLFGKRKPLAGEMTQRLFKTYMGFPPPSDQ